MSEKKKCPACNGTGRCPKCGGTGRRGSVMKCPSCALVAPGGYRGTKDVGTGVCSKCNGKGEI